MSDLSCIITCIWSTVVYIQQKVRFKFPCNLSFNTFFVKFPFFKDSHSWLFVDVRKLCCNILSSDFVLGQTCQHKLAFSMYEALFALIIKIFKTWTVPSWTVYLRFHTIPNPIIKNLMLTDKKTPPKYNPRGEDPTVHSSKNIWEQI